MEHPVLWPTRKGGLRRPSITLYFYFTKSDSFTAPTFEIFYLNGNERVRS